MSSATRSLRLASRVLRPQTRSVAVLSSALLQSTSASSASSSFAPAPRQSSFQLAGRRSYSSAPIPKSNMAYDKEIDDIAEYVQKPINSELAVSFLSPLFCIASMT